MDPLGDGVFESPAAVLEQGGRGRRGLVLRIAIPLVISERLSRQEGDVDVEDPDVAGRGDIVGGDELPARGSGRLGE